MLKISSFKLMISGILAFCFLLFFMAPSLGSKVTKGARLVRERLALLVVQIGFGHGSPEPVREAVAVVPVEVPSGMSRGQNGAAAASRTRGMRTNVLG
jgi:hypothetical protein